MKLKELKNWWDFKRTMGWNAKLCGNCYQGLLRTLWYGETMDCPVCKGEGIVYLNRPSIRSK